MNKDNIIIVGNGTSILEKKNGKKIDKFDTVVRLNGFQTEKYEVFTGTKTNIWMTCNLAHRKNIHHFDEVIFHSWGTENTCKVFKQIKEMRNDIRMLDKKYVKKTKLITPSTGLLAIFYFLEKYDKIYITGFDWWQNREKHHYFDSVKQGENHTPSLEKTVIDNLGDKIKFLI